MKRFAFVQIAAMLVAAAASMSVASASGSGKGGGSGGARPAPPPPAISSRASSSSRTSSVPAAPRPTAGPPKFKGDQPIFTKMPRGLPTGGSIRTPAPSRRSGSITAPRGGGNPLGILGNAPASKVPRTPRSTISTRLPRTRAGTPRLSTPSSATQISPTPRALRRAQKSKILGKKGDAVVRRLPRARWEKKWAAPTKGTSGQGPLGYHAAKHAEGRSAVRYTREALKFQQRHRNSSSWTHEKLEDQSAGRRLRIRKPKKMTGLYTASGKPVSLSIDYAKQRRKKNRKTWHE